jgi:hypothetical protein
LARGPLDDKLAVHAWKLGDIARRNGAIALRQVSPKTGAQAARKSEQRAKNDQNRSKMSVSRLF